MRTTKTRVLLSEMNKAYIYIFQKWIRQGGRDLAGKVMLAKLIKSRLEETNILLEKRTDIKICSFFLSAFKEKSCKELDREITKIVFSQQKSTQI